MNVKLSLILVFLAVFIGAGIILTSMFHLHDYNLHGAASTPSEEDRKLLDNQRYTEDVGGVLLKSDFDSIADGSGISAYAMNKGINPAYSLRLECRIMDGSSGKMLIKKGDVRDALYPGEEARYELSLDYPGLTLSGYECEWSYALLP